MKERQVIWTKQALNALDEIYTYIAYESSMTAYKVIRQILLKTENLIKFPEMGQIEPHFQKSGYEYRYLVSGNYKIIYRNDNEKSFIMTIFDCRRDPSSMLL